jgi:hypothetical protein
LRGERHTELIPDGGRKRLYPPVATDAADGATVMVVNVGVTVTDHATGHRLIALVPNRYLEVVGARFAKCRPDGSAAFVPFAVNVTGAGGVPSWSTNK